MRGGIVPDQLVYTAGSYKASSKQRMASYFNRSAKGQVVLDNNTLVALHSVANALTDPIDSTQLRALTDAFVGEDCLARIDGMLVNIPHVFHDQSVHEALASLKSNQVL